MQNKQYIFIISGLKPLHPIELGCDILFIVLMLSLNVICCCNIGLHKNYLLTVQLFLLLEGIYIFKNVKFIAKLFNVPVINWKIIYRAFIFSMIKY